MTDARLAAARAVATVLNGHSLDQAVATQAVDSRQRPFAQALAYTCIRHLGSARALLRMLLNHPDRERPPLLDAIVMCGLTELRHMATPSHAAVAESVAAARELGLPKQAGLINALLRRYLRERTDLDAKLALDPVARSEHPQWWIKQLEQDWPEQAGAILRAGDQRAPLWLRVNTQRSTRAGMLERIAEAGLVAKPHPQLVDALRVDPPVPVEQLPGFANGMLSVQDAAAQRVVEWAQPRAGQRILDACAAPGGKTAHLLERCPDAEVWALDIDADRVQRIEENLRRLDLKAQVRCADACKPDSWWDGEPFDRILIDAPCTGSGVTRRHPDIKWLRRASDPQQLAQTQARLLNTLWPLLAPGGRLIYTTCSVFRAENQAVIAEFVDNLEAAERAQLSHWQPAGAEVNAWMPHGLQVLPGDNDEDGFFYAAVERA